MKGTKIKTQRPNTISSGLRSIIPAGAISFAFVLFAAGWVSISVEAENDSLYNLFGVLLILAGLQIIVLSIFMFFMNNTILGLTKERTTQ